MVDEIIFELCTYGETTLSRFYAIYNFLEVIRRSIDCRYLARASHDALKLGHLFVERSDAKSGEGQTRCYLGKLHSRNRHYIDSVCNTAMLLKAHYT